MANPDATLLSWITAEVNQALALVRERIAQQAAARQEAGALSGCREPLHQVSGALRMVGLGGATRFCESLEACFAAPDCLASGEALALADRAVIALREFVADVERGEANAPLRLYPLYRELAGLQHRADCHERELFFPDLTRSAPSHPSPVFLAPEALREVLLAQRAEFQRGLLAWLRNAGGLEQMGAAVSTLYQSASHVPEQRPLWWISKGLIELLGAERDEQWVAASRPLCNRLEREMRNLAEGSPGSREALLRDLLYAIGAGKADTPLAQEIRALYQLTQLFPLAQSEETGEVRSRLETLKSAWVHYVCAEPQGLSRFREAASAACSRQGAAGSPLLLQLLDAIVRSAERLPDPYPQQDQYMVVEMASAFLLAEHVAVAEASRLAELEEQVAIMGGWLLASAEGKSNGAPPQGLRDEYVQHIGEVQLRAQVAKQVVVNLRHMEQVVDAYARDPGKRDSLQTITPHARQVQGALKVLGFPRAAQAAALCEELLAHVTDPARQSGGELDWMAEGLSSLGFFLDPCLHGREPNAASLERFFERYERREGEEAAAPGREGPAEAATLSAATGAGLLAIFLEEAKEVLAGIGQALDASRRQPGDVEALTTLRRGFHTLKGSGRMVGVMDLAEVAWELEQLFNLWLEQKREASAELLDLVAEATARFGERISQLAEGRAEGEFQASEVVGRARELRSAERPSPSVLEIYRNEAQAHMAAIEAELARWRATPGSEASRELMRAAHTLASSSGTAGFDAIARLAAALEHWTACAALTTQAADVACVESAVGALRLMTASLGKGEPPADGVREAEELSSLITRLQASTVASVLPTPQSERSEKRAIHDDVDAELLPAFLEEAQELVPAIGGSLREWKGNDSDEAALQSLRRGLHTLKGSARMAGAIRLGELAHLMESNIEAAIEENRGVSAELFADLEEKMDRLSAAVEGLKQPTPVVAAAPAPAKREQPAVETPAARLRIYADALDHLINQAGEVSIARSRAEAELRAIRNSLGDLADSVTRLRSQLREIEIQADSQLQSRLTVLEERENDYDPLELDRYTRLQELTRLMAESLNDVLSTQQALSRGVGETDAALLQQARIAREVQQELMRMRAVPFAQLTERLHRVVRQAARELDKKAELEIRGADVELDRSVLERIAPALEHMLRNAVAHGLEAPAARVQANKPEAGRIALTLRQEASEIALTLADDGAGIDLDRLQRKAVEKGLVAAVDQLTQAQQLQLVFATGLSSAEQVTELAGRGVGMDVVRNEIGAIGGRIDLATEKGAGTAVTLHLPLTLAVTRAVLVRSVESMLAVPAALVEQVLRLKADALRSLYDAREVEFRDVRYPLHSVQRLLEGAGENEIRPYNSVLLLRSGNERVAVHVDELAGNQEIVVKRIGPQLARLPWLGGATVLADGRIVPIVNPVVLAQRSADSVSSSVATSFVPVVEKAGATQAPLVMVVDDSLTMRRITSRLLEREGYAVLTAKDGVEALEHLRECLPVVMLVDIEMPRMDGFELTRNVRADARTKEIPIIVISSRTAQKHRAQAEALGVDAFLGKPFQEAELLERIHELRAARENR